MKKLIIPLLLAQLLAPVFAFAQLTESEQAFALKCHNNVNTEKKQFSIATAYECLEKLNINDGALLNKLNEQNPEATLDILTYNNALIDLKSIITGNPGREMLPHLERVLEKDVCPLCDMELGPQPEKIFKWVGKEAGACLADVKKTVRTWEILGDIRTRSLSSGDYNYDQESWGNKSIKERYSILGDWAAKETDKLAAIYGNKAYSGKRSPDPRLIAVLREDLADGNNRSQLLKLKLLSPGKIGDWKPPAPSPAEKKAEELDAASTNVSRLEAQSESDQAAYLSKTFDKTGDNAGGVSETGTGIAAAKPGGFVFKELSPEQVSGLSERLVTADDKGNLKGPFADELRGTKAGDEILAFYKDPKYAKTGTNRLNFSFTEQPSGQFGGWSLSSRKINLNSELVNDWMEKNHVTPEQLFEGDPSKNPRIQKLSQYLAPTFVHESTHQRQAAKAAAAGYDYLAFFSGVRTAPYQMEMETEAFSMDSSFMAEHLLKRGPSYADNLDSFDKKNTELFLKEGVEGVRLSNHRNYPGLESLEGSAAKEFSAAASTAKDLKALKAKYKAAPQTLDAAELDQMRDLQASMNSRFKWYAAVYADSAAAEAKINGWREEINSKLYPSKTLGKKAPQGFL